MDRTLNQSCPRCDYNQGPAGSNTSALNGLLHCENCGGTWRDLGTTTVSVPARRSAGHLPIATAALFATSGGPAQVVRTRRSGRAGLATAIASCLLAAFAGWHGVMNVRAANQIEITELSARQVQRDGRIAVQIEGRLSNRSTSPIALGDVDIVLSHDSGHRIYSWVHRPAVDHIDPGQSIRFSTADGSVPEIATRVEVRAGRARISTSL